MSKLGKFAAACVAVLGAFGAFGGSDYRFAEYIERNNSSTISTGVKITANTTKIEFGVQDSLGETARLDKKLMGEGTSAYFCFATLNGTWRVASNGSFVQGGPGKDSQRIDVTVTGTASSSTSWRIVRADGVSGTVSSSKFSSTGNSSIYLFGQGGTGSAPAGFRFFYLRHYETIEGVERLSNFVVPAERLSDHAAGLYDIVTGSFFKPSSGSVVLSEKGNGAFAEMLEVVGNPNNRGNVSPAYGVHLGYPAETPVLATAPATWTSADGNGKATCVGYKVYTNDVEWISDTFTGDDERVVNFTRPVCAEGVRLEWQWSEIFHITVSVPAVGGSVKGETDFWAEGGSEVTIEAVPDEGYSFLRFTGDVAPEKAYDNPLVFTASGPAALAVQFSKGAASPAVVREKAVFWLDAMDECSLLCDENNLVTNWISRAGGDEKRATVPADYLAPTNDTTTFDIPTVNFGKVESKIDMVFPRITNLRTVFFVVKIANTQDAFLIGDLIAYQFHRGGGGQYGDGTNAKYSKVWDMGEVVSAWSSVAIPSGSFRVIAIRTSGNCSVSSLTQDRTYGQIPKRNGGKQLSELILFNEALDDSQVATVNNYLMRKWGFATEKLAVVGSPDTYAGYPTPAYGNHTEFKAGDSVVFKMPSAVFTNDSQTFATELKGWTFLDSDGSRTDGTALETPMTYGERLMYSSFTWNWSGVWSRVKVKLPREPKLPGLYREVVYLETGADGGIATGIKLTTATSEVAFRFGAAEGTAYTDGATGDQKWFGSTAGDTTMFAFGHHLGRWRILARNSWDSPSCYASSHGPLDVVIRGKSWSFLDLEADTYSRQTATYPLVGETDSTSTIGIFSGNGIRAPAGARFYGLRIWEQGVLVHHLVPCYQRRDKTTRQLLETPIPGVYDRVTGTFKAGTGTLVCGPDVPLPGLAILLR